MRCCNKRNGIRLTINTLGRRSVHVPPGTTVGRNAGSQYRTVRAAKMGRWARFKACLKHLLGMPGAATVRVPITKID